MKLDPSTSGYDGVISQDGELRRGLARRVDHFRAGIFQRAAEMTVEQAVQVVRGDVGAGHFRRHLRRAAQLEAAAGDDQRHQKKGEALTPRH